MDRFVFSTEFCQRDGHQGIEADNDPKPRNIFFVIRVPKSFSDRLGKDRDQNDKTERGENQRQQRGAKNGVLIIFCTAIEAEKCGLHAIGQ